MQLRLWNPKAKQYATVAVTQRPGSETLALEVISEADDRFGSSGYVYTGDSSRRFFRFDAQDAWPPGRGWGLVLYVAGALAAGCHGGRGIYSVVGRRSGYAHDLWEKMIAHGLASRDEYGEVDTLTTAAARRLYRGVEGVRVSCSPRVR